MIVYNEKCFTNYVEKVRDIECKEESKGVFNYRFRTDNKSTNGSEMSINISSSTSIRYRTIQNFGGRKLWRNSSLQKLVDNILANAQIQLKI